MTECMQTCQKFQRARSPKTTTLDELQVVIQKVQKMVFVPGTTILKANGYSQSFWLAITDEREEGMWLDWYTGDKVNLLDGASGEIGEKIIFSSTCFIVFC